MLFSSLVISIFYLLLEGHKAPAFLFLTSFIVFRYYLFGFRLSIANVFLLVFLPLGLLVLYIFSFGYADSLSYGVKKFLERLFVGQTQGLYYVVEYVDPSISYIKSMLPFSSLFFSDATRAVEDVVSYVYGFSVTTVNMNSLFITDAYSIFGILGVIFFTVYFSFFVYILFIFLKSFSRSFHVIVIPLSFVIFALLPITNTLTYFVFPKELFSVFILFFGIGLFYNCLTKNKHKVMN